MVVASGKQQQQNGHATKEEEEENGHATTKDENSCTTTTTTVSLSPIALVLTVISSLCIAFGGGCMAKPYLLTTTTTTQHCCSSRETDLGPSSSSMDALGLVEAKEGKVKGPISIYSFQNFDKDVCGKEKTLNGTKKDSDDDSCSVHAGEEEDEETTNASTAEVDDDDDDDDEEDDDEEEEAPILISSTGQHLVVDMEHVEMDLLNSDERLSQAIIETAQEAGMTLRSVHCHALIPMGVSCVGMLGRGHVAFHTWPVEGVITLDFFTWSMNGPLHRFLDIVVSKFGVRRNNDVPTGVVWSRKRRGFGHGLTTDVVGELAQTGYLFKEQLVSAQTPFQLIQIMEIINPRESFEKDKTVFLNGVLQSSLFGDAPYHEALVHPAMFAHDGPERVAIIGGGEGATLREVLKHKTVKNAIMVEIDQIMMDVCREYLPEWNDCSDFGGAPNCFDEPRANVYAEDALAWFIDRFYETKGQKANSKGLDNAEKMDVIIMDALDPQDQADFCEALYNNDVFLEALFSALTEKGVLVMQLGEASEIKDAPEELTIHHNRANIVQELQEVGFTSVHIFDEGHCSFGGAWTYLVAFKNVESRRNWYANEAEIQLALHQRSLKTKSNGLPFRYFDGATMVSYQTPPKAAESVFCQQDPTSNACATFRGFDPNKPNIPAESLEVKMSTVGENAERGVFTTVDIPKDSYVGIEKGVDSVEFPLSTRELLTDLMDHEEGYALDAVDEFMDAYGLGSDERGGAETSVDSSILAFANHGCNGTYNIGWFPGEHGTEFTVDFAQKPITHYEQDASLYNPVRDRNRRHLNAGGGISLRNIRAGEELLENHLSMTSSLEDWESDVRELRAFCSVGDVTKDEDEHAE